MTLTRSGSAEDGYRVTSSRPDPAPPSHDPDLEDTLRITWLGTASYHIQLADSVILTDPFYSHHWFTALLGELEPDTELIGKLFDRLPGPDAIFVGHAHYDHLMDIMPVIDRFDESNRVRVYGSSTTGNLLSGYNRGHAWPGFEEVEPGRSWRAVPGSRLAYRAMPAEHADNIGSFLVFDGRVEKALEEPPTRAWHYRVGDTFTYLFRLGEEPDAFTVFFTSTATPFPKGFPEGIGSVDVAILCVPSWEKAKGYPGEFIRNLKPRHIVLSHFNDFFTGYERRRTLRLSGFDGFLEKVKKAASELDDFESILIPDLNVTMRFRR